MPKWTEQQKKKFHKTMKLKRRLAKSSHALVVSSEEAQPETVPVAALHYAHGYTRAWIESFAERIGVSAGTLTWRVGELLHYSQSGPRKAGVKHRVPSV